MSGNTSTNSRSNNAKGEQKCINYFHGISHLAPRTTPALIGLSLELNLSDKQVQPLQ